MTAFADWVVYEWATGTVWSVTPPTRATARAEAELCGQGHEAVTRAEADRLSNAFAHGRMAHIRQMRKPLCGLEACDIALSCQARDTCGEAPQKAAAPTDDDDALPPPMFDLLGGDAA